MSGGPAPRGRARSARGAGPVPGAARALIVAPHPDDETIGCFGLVRRLRRQGAAVCILVVTDGGASHPGSRLWPRARLVRAREAETRRAAARMGVAAGAVHFLRLADGGLDGDAAAARCLRRAVARSCRCGLLAGPCTGDDHADHRATARHLAAVRLPGVHRLTYRVWPLGTRARRARPLALSIPVQAAKRSVLRGYRTQCGLIADDPAGFAMTARHIAGFTRSREWFAG